MRKIYAWCIVASLMVPAQAPVVYAGEAVATPTPGLDERLKTISEAVAKVNERVGKIENKLQQPDDRECPGFIIEKGTAETNCPVYTDVTTALELQQADDFAEPFPRIGFRGRLKLPELFERATVTGDRPDDSWFGENPAKPVNFVLRPHAYIDVSLASVAVAEKESIDTSSDTDNTPDDNGRDDDTDSTDEGDDTADDSDKDEKDAISLDGKRSLEMHGGFMVDLFDYRTRVRTERYAEDQEAEQAALKALNQAEDRVVHAMERYTVLQGKQWDYLSKDDAQADLEATVADWKRVREANLDDETGTGNFKKYARGEADMAEKAWRDAQEKLKNAVTASQQADKASAEVGRKAEKDHRSRALKAYRAERTLAEAKIALKKAATDDAKGAVSKAQAAYEEALLELEDGDDAIVTSLRDSEAAQKAATAQVAQAEKLVQSAEKAMAAIAMREIAYEQYFQARARVRSFRIRYYTEYAPVFSIAAVGELGARTPDLENVDLLQSHFVGARIYYRGASILNGMFLEIGWGTSENLITNTDKRVKFRANLPFRFTAKGSTPSKAFVRFEVDSDFRSGEDEVRVSIGNAVDFNRILNILGMGAIGG